MPIRPEQRDLYPPNWRELSRFIRFNRAGGRCEWTEENGERCPRCHGDPIAGNARGAKTILTVMHLDHDPRNNDQDNLLAACQYHHLKYDAAYHAQNASVTKRKRKEAMYETLLFQEKEQK